MYRRGINAGNPFALANLGLLLQQTGRLTEAEDLLRRAADAGSLDAMSAAPSSGAVATRFDSWAEEAHSNRVPAGPTVVYGAVLGTDPGVRHVVVLVGEQAG